MAGVGSRFIALVFDTLIQILSYLALVIGINQLWPVSNLDDTLPSGAARNWAIAIVALVTFLLFVLYFVLFESVTRGQTPGKRIVGLRVVKENGQPLQFIDTLVRNFVRLIDFFPGIYAVGSLTMLLNDRAKRLGDFAAGTIVIKEGGAVKLADLTGSTSLARAIPELEPLFETSARRVNESEVAAIESLIRRWPRLSNGHQVADALARALKIKLQLDPGELQQLGNMDDRTFLEQLAAAYRRRSSGI